MSKLNFFTTVNPSIAFKFINYFKAFRPNLTDIKASEVIAKFIDEKGVTETVVEEGFDWADTDEGYAYWQSISEQWKDLMALRTKVEKKEEELAELKKSFNSSLDSFERQGC